MRRMPPLPALWLARCFGRRWRCSQASACVLALVPQHPKGVKDITLGVAEEPTHGEKSFLAAVLTDGVVNGAVLQHGIVGHDGAPAEREGNLQRRLDQRADRA